MVWWIADNQPNEQEWEEYTLGDLLVHQYLFQVFGSIERVFHSVDDVKA